MAEKKKDVEVVNAEDNAKKALAAHKQQETNNEAAANSTIASTFGATETFTIAADTDHSYSVTLRFPGTAIAAQIEDDASNQYDGINSRVLMEAAIKHVIVSPKITSLSFWDEHHGFSEVVVRVLQFLNSKLN